MANRRFFVCIEIDADTFGDTPPDNLNILRAINSYCHAGPRNAGSVYIQNARTVNVLDEKGKEI